MCLHGHSLRDDVQGSVGGEWGEPCLSFFFFFTSAGAETMVSGGLSTTDICPPEGRLHQAGILSVFLLLNSSTMMGAWHTLRVVDTL